MTDPNIEMPPARKRRLLIPVAAVLVIGLFAGLFYYTYTCPCDRTPGAILLGPVAAEPVSDWSFANEVELCQIQIHAGWRPHAINLNCMASADGNLYLSCSICTSKYWAGKVLDDPRGRLRLNGTVYPVTITRVTQPAEMDKAWQARVDKLAVVGGPGNPAPPIDAQRDAGWWTFRVQSAI